MLHMVHNGCGKSLETLKVIKKKKPAVCWFSLGPSMNGGHAGAVETVLPLYCRTTTRGKDKPLTF